MVIFCGMVLILAVGGTGALLHRNVLLPIRNLQDFADRLHGGDKNAEHPSGIAEVEALAWRFRQMALKGEQGMVDSDSLTRQPKTPDASSAGPEDSQRTE
jgi:HAMP domain-containing protein